MQKVWFVKHQKTKATKLLSARYRSDTIVLFVSASLSVLQTYRLISRQRGLHLGHSSIWIQLIETQTHWAILGKDQLAWPRGRRVQIDTDPLLVKHICQTEASPAARDRCWWSKLFSGDLRRSSKDPKPLCAAGESLKLQDKKIWPRNIWRPVRKYDFWFVGTLG